MLIFQNTSGSQEKGSVAYTPSPGACRAPELLQKTQGGQPASEPGAPPRRTSSMAGSLGALHPHSQGALLQSACGRMALLCTIVLTGSAVQGLCLHRTQSVDPGKRACAWEKELRRGPGSRKACWLTSLHLSARCQGQHLAECGWEGGAAREPGDQCSGGPSQGFLVFLHLPRMWHWVLG